MTINQERDGNWLTLRLEGRLDTSTAPALEEIVMNSFGSGIRTLGCAGMPDIPELRARYMAEQHPTPETNPAPTASTGGEPDADTGDWQAQARLDLEKIRF